MNADAAKSNFLVLAAPTPLHEINTPQNFS